MEKLIYKEYRGCENIIEIDLHNGYSVIAIKIWNHEKKNYTVELRLTANAIPKWDLMDDYQSLEFNTNYKYINSAILKEVSNIFENGGFEKEISRMNYETKCFERGNDLYEDEGVTSFDV